MRSRGSGAAASSRALQHAVLRLGHGRVVSESRSLGVSLLAISAVARPTLRESPSSAGRPCASGQSQLQPPARCGPRSVESDSSPRFRRLAQTAPRDAARDTAFRSNAARARRHTCTARHLAHTPRAAPPRERTCSGRAPNRSTAARLQRRRRAGAVGAGAECYSTIAGFRRRRRAGAVWRSTVAGFRRRRRAGAVHRLAVGAVHGKGERRKGDRVAVSRRAGAEAARHGVRAVARTDSLAQCRLEMAGIRGRSGAQFVSTTGLRG